MAVGDRGLDRESQAERWQCRLGLDRASQALEVEVRGESVEVDAV